MVKESIIKWKRDSLGGSGNNFPWNYMTNSIINVFLEWSILVRRLVILVTGETLHQEDLHSFSRVKMVTRRIGTPESQTFGAIQTVQNHLVLGVSRRTTHQNHRTRSNSPSTPVLNSPLVVTSVCRTPDSPSSTTGRRKGRRTGCPTTPPRGRATTTVFVSSRGEPPTSHSHSVSRGVSGTSGDCPDRTWPTMRSKRGEDPTIATLLSVGPTGTRGVTVSLGCRGRVVVVLDSGRSRVVVSFSPTISTVVRRLRCRGHTTSFPGKTGTVNTVSSISCISRTCVAKVTVVVSGRRREVSKSRHAPVIS